MFYCFKKFANRQPWGILYEHCFEISAAIKNNYVLA